MWIIIINNLKKIASFINVGKKDETKYSNEFVTNL
jgi:hypothetical protein